MTITYVYIYIYIILCYYNNMIHSRVRVFFYLFFINLISTPRNTHRVKKIKMTLDLFLVLKFHVILGVILACVTYQLNFQLVKTNYHAPYKHISSFSSFFFVAVLGLEGVSLDIFTRPWIIFYSIYF